MDSDTQLFSLIGYPVSHSLSPVMHNAAFASLGINAVYLAFSVEVDDLHDSVRGMAALGFAGVNVTAPHKVRMIGLLRDIDESAENVGAVNTLVAEDGEWIGHNTDLRGIEAVFRTAEVDVSTCRPVVFGTGGAARAVVAALAMGGCSDIKVVGRNKDHLRAFIRDSSDRHAPPIEASLNSLGEISSSLEDVDLVVNATPVGMHPHADASILSPDLIDPRMTVFDMVYQPRRTRLLRHAKQRGARTIGGAEMLLEQGAASLELWLGRKAPRDVMGKALEQALV